MPYDFMELFDHVFESGEEKIIGRMTEILSIAKRANKEVLRIVNRRSRSIVPSKQMEKESDTKVFTLSSMAASGAVSPNILDDVLNLIDQEDSIVDAIFNLARELLRYSISDKKTSEILKGRLLTILGLAGEALDEFAIMLSTDDVARIRRSREKIEQLEQEGDELKDFLLDFAYKSRMDFKAFYYISEIAHKSDDILDSCENSADIYMSIMDAIAT